MVAKSQESITYSVEYKGENFSVIFDTHCNIGNTDIYVYDEEGVNLCDLADDSLAQEIIEYVNSNKE